MSILANSNAIDNGNNAINNSLRFLSASSTYLARTPSITSNQKTYTFSTWFKRGALGSVNTLFSAFYGNASRYTTFLVDSNDTMQINSGIYSTGASTTTSYNLITTQLFRDPAAWYH